MLICLAAFSNFLDYCFLFEFSGDRRRDQVTMNGAIKNARKADSTAALKDYRFVAQEMRAKVPTRSLVCKGLKGSLKLLEENLNESNLSYKEQQALNFFILQVRLNTRSGPILHLDWDDLAVIEETEEPVATDRHKTGKYFAVHLFLQEDQRALLKKMRDCFFSENGIESQYIFASKKNKVERSISRHLQETFQDLFGDSLSEVRFNANSIRKYWERRWKEIKMKIQITEGVNKAHLAQTAHGEKRHKDVYIGKEGSNQGRKELLSIYDKDLREDPESNENDDQAEEQPAAVSDSEISDDNNEAAQESPQKSPVVKGFNTIRNSLNTSNTAHAATHASPHAATQSTSSSASSRASLNSTLGSDNTSEVRKKFEKSLRTFRVKAGEQKWTDDEKKACLLFKDIHVTVSLEDVKARLLEGGFKLDASSSFRISNKLKAAVRILK